MNCLSKYIFFILLVFESHVSFAGELKFTGSIPPEALPKAYPYLKNTCDLNITINSSTRKITKIFAWAAWPYSKMGFNAKFDQTDEQKPYFDAKLIYDDKMNLKEATAIKDNGIFPEARLVVENYGAPDMSLTIINVVMDRTGISWPQDLRCMNLVPTVGSF